MRLSLPRLSDLGLAHAWSGSIEGLIICGDPPNQALLSFVFNTIAEFKGETEKDDFLILPKENGRIIAIPAVTRS